MPCWDIKKTPPCHTRSYAQYVQLAAYPQNDGNERAAYGVDRINITKDIIVDKPIYVVGNVNIYPVFTKTINQYDVIIYNGD